MDEITQQWISSLEFTIADLREKNRKAYYAFSLKMTQKTANAIKSYFESQNYNVEITQCPRKQWDLIISWS